MDPAKDPNRGKVLPVIDPDTRQPTGQYINYDDVPWGNLTTFDENGNPVAFPNSTDPHQGPLTWDILDLFENLNNPYL
jgi:hypothetical protein